jgi:nitrogen fixation NifU-like protein
MYSPQVLDHFQNPRNPGAVEGADAVVQMENPACGDTLQLSAKTEAGRIRQIGFLAKGCVPAMACASVLTELVRGKTLDEARKLRGEDLIVKLGGLPEASTHAPHLAMEVLAALLNKLAQADRGSLV